MKPTAPAKKAQASKEPAKDSYARYLSAIALFMLVACALAIFLYAEKHFKHHAEVQQSYMALPQLIIENDDQVVRLQVAVQSALTDSKWMEQNKKKIDEIFQVSVKSADVMEFGTIEGCEAIQQQIKDDINEQLHTNKVQAVWYADLLRQTKQ